MHFWRTTFGNFPLQRRVSQPEPEERLAWKAEMASTAGVYATFGIDREGALVAKQLLRGGQFMNKINPGDALMSVDGKPVDGMSIEEVRDMLVGPEGSQVQLEFWRRGQEPGSEGRMLVVNPYRTVTEAQEIQVGSTPPPLHVPRLYPARRPRAMIIKDQYRSLLRQLARATSCLAWPKPRSSEPLGPNQIATLLELTELVSTKSHDFGPNSIWETAKITSWRMPGSVDDTLHKQLCDAAMLPHKLLWEEQNKGEPAELVDLRRQVKEAKQRISYFEAHVAHQDEELRHQKERPSPRARPCCVCCAHRRQSMRSGEDAQPLRRKGRAQGELGEAARGHRHPAGASGARQRARALRGAARLTLSRPGARTCWSARSRTTSSSWISIAP